MTKKKIEPFLEAARHVATQSSMLHRHGCVIVYGGQIIAKACNVHCCSPSASGLWSIHAEVNAIRKVKSRRILSECDMYIVRIGPEAAGFPFKLSKPCRHCQTIIEEVGVRTVFYSWDENGLTVNYSRVYDNPASKDTRRRNQGLSCK
jgi:deoxycytidylate deaminase